MQNLWEGYRDRGVVLVGVDYVDTEINALDFIQEFGITYPNGPDLGTRISDDYHIQGVPETFAIDQKGNVVQFVIAPYSPVNLNLSSTGFLPGKKRPHHDESIWH